MSLAEHDLFTLAEARKSREHGIQLVEESESSLWMRAAALAIDSLAARGDPFSADDIRRMVGAPLHPNAMGAAFLRAVEGDGLLNVGMVQSKRPEARGRWIPQYRGVR